MKEKDFAIRIYKKSKDPLWRIEHCARVERCCMLLAAGKPVDKTILRKAAWLHDIGRIIADEDHPKHSAAMAEKEFGPLDPRLKDAILNHGTEHHPTTAEGRIVQLSDKLSILSYESFIQDAKEDKQEATAWLKKLVGRIEKLVLRYDF